MKTCSKCGETKPLDEFWRRTLCRACRRAWENAYKKRRRESEPGYRERLNAACRAWYDERKDDPEFRASERERLRRLYEENSAVREAQRRWQREKSMDPQWRARRRDAERQRMADPVRWRAELEKDNAYRRRRYAEDPAYRERVIARIRARKAVKRGANGGEIIALDALMERDGGRCHLCGKRVLRGDASTDHLVPLSMGGGHTWRNVALAHVACNARRQHVGPAQLRLLG